MRYRAGASSLSIPNGVGQITDFIRFTAIIRLDKFRTVTRVRPRSR